MGPDEISLSMADAIIAKFPGCGLNRIDLAYAIMEWGEANPLDDDTTPQPRGEGMVLEAMERAAEEIEQGHAWITAVAASKIIRKHAAMLAAAPGEGSGE